MRRYFFLVSEGRGILVSHSYNSFTGKSILTVDGETYVQRLLPFCMGVKRREPFRVGEKQCILAVDYKGEAEIVFEGKTVRHIPKKEALRRCREQNEKKANSEETNLEREYMQ